MLTKKPSDEKRPSVEFNKRVKHWNQQMQLLQLLWNFRLHENNPKLGLSHLNIDAGSGLRRACSSCSPRTLPLTKAHVPASQPALRLQRHFYFLLINW
jgi:hypothetical protein